METETERVTVAAPTVRERFGGIDTPAALMGMFTALGVLVFLGALIGAGANELAYQINAYDVEGNLTEVAIAGVLTAVVVVFVAFLAGGWASGRMARYDGGINGLASGMWMLLLVAVFAALGAFVADDLNAFRIAGLPDWFSQIRGEDVTGTAVLGAVLASVATLLGGYLGGRVGERYHRDADSALVNEARGRRRDASDPAG